MSSASWSPKDGVKIGIADGVNIRVERTVSFDGMRFNANGPTHMAPSYFDQFKEKFKTMCDKKCTCNVEWNSLSPIGELDQGEVTIEIACAKQLCPALDENVKLKPVVGLTKLDIEKAKSIVEAGISLLQE